jgi:plastocyanin
MRSLPIAPAMLAAFAVALLAGCANQSASSSLPTSAAAPTNIAFTEHQLAVPSLVADAKAGGVGVRLTSENPTTNKHYGRVIGYFKGTTSMTSQVVMLSADTNVTFTNVDSSLPHTASFLGDATKKSAPWPTSFTGSSSASSAGTDIGTSGFSTGTLTPGHSSAVYNTGAPGFYMFGCFYHYVSEGMRTVIIVKAG